jgi:hypothetical protein
MNKPNSPTPWAQGLLPRCSKFIILAAEDSCGLRDDVAEFLRQEDRDFALRAANSHKDLVEMLRTVTERLYRHGKVEDMSWVARARDVIDRAEGRTE